LPFILRIVLYKVGKENAGDIGNEMQYAICIYIRNDRDKSSLM